VSALFSRLSQQARSQTKDQELQPIQETIKKQQPSPMPPEKSSPEDSEYSPYF
jgi:hypothetical protein